MVSASSTSLLVVALIGLASGLGHAQTGAKPMVATPAVVFVCEHGAAKSVIATAYFNKIAAERGLPFRATFRGTSPQENLSLRTVEGLKADGVAAPPGKPAAITDADVANATHIFAIGCTLPDNAHRSGKAADWSDVPDDGGVRADARCDRPTREAVVVSIAAIETHYGVGHE